MPLPLVPTTSSENLARREPISRVTSFKRDWEGSDELKHTARKLGSTHSGDMAASRAFKRARSDAEIEWSPTPPKQPDARAAPAAAPAPPAADTAAARRRAAMLAALAQPGAGSDSGLGGPGPSSMAAKREVANAPWAADSLKHAKKPAPGAMSIGQAINAGRKQLTIKQQIVLSEEQKKVLSMVVDEGKSVFFTGSAGTGKSVLLREIISSLRKKHVRNPDAVAVTASTGIAACNIGGQTLHSFSGVGLGTNEVPQLVTTIKRNKKAMTRWLRTKVLIIDEISMVDGHLFDKLCKIGATLRKRPTVPFGGIQIIVTGDFFQLPPVQKGGGQPTFAFEAQMWRESVQVSVNLTQVFRQKDQTFVDMLNEMRFGRMSAASINAFSRLQRPLPEDDGIAPTELFPRREDVERANNNRLISIGADLHTYRATDGPNDSDQVKNILVNMMAPPVIQLKKDAQVMLIKNIDESLVNGSMGRVLGFCQKHLYREDASGRWMENAVPDEEDEDLSKPQDAKKKANSEVNRAVELPVVRFRVPGNGTRDMIVDLDQFKVELPSGETVASRLQLPLILAWAMSIHKSQGQTLDKVKVDLGRVFEKGQAYVALSRATSLQGLQVLGFNGAKVQAHPKVTQWSSTLVTY